MDSIRFLSNESSQNDQSTIQLEFSETTVQIPATTHDLNSNSYASLHRYYARKRYPSTESQSTSSNEKGYMRKKQRNNHDQQIVSLSESDETQTIAMNLTRQEQKGSCQRSVSLQNISDQRFDWIKDFMRQSLNAIRDTVVQACLTAISARSIVSLNSNIPIRDVNVNNHLIRLARSEHSLPSRQTRQSWLHDRTAKESKNDPLLVDHRLDDTAESNSKTQRIHYRARTSPYPMYQDVLRTPVSDIHVPWSSDWPQYRPTIFTAEEIYINPGADPGTV